jgi:16S rRNA processing protein RimM
LSPSYTSVAEFFLLGKSLKSHGTSGGLRLMVEDQFKGYLLAGNYVFLDLNGVKVPFRITDVEEGNHFVIFLEDVANKKDSDALSGLELWVPLNFVKPRHQKSPKNIPGKWDEYQIHDNQKESFHKIERVEEFPQQMMAVIQMNEKEVLIPLSDHLITSIDKEKKIIHMELPEGIMDL